MPEIGLNIKNQALFKKRYGVTLSIYGLRFQIRSLFHPPRCQIAQLYYRE